MAVEPPVLQEPPQPPVLQEPPVTLESSVLQEPPQPPVLQEPVLQEPLQQPSVLQEPSVLPLQQPLVAVQQPCFALGGPSHEDVTSMLSRESNTRRPEQTLLRVGFELMVD